MSQFGNVSREIQFRKRASGPGIEPTGIVVTPNAPGLVVNDAPSGAAIGFYELARSMGLLATTAGEIGQARAIAQSNERQRLQDLNDAVREAEREATRIEQSDAETARMLRAENEADYGLGVDRGQEWIPAIGSRISAGEFDRLTPEAAAEQILLNETNGQDPHFAAGVAEYAKPRLMAKLYERRSAVLEDARRGTIDVFASGLASGRPIDQVRDAATGAGMSVDDFDVALITAAEVAAQSGERDRFESLTTATSRPYTSKVADLQRTLSITEAGQVRAASERAKNSLDAMNLAGAPFEQVETSAKDLMGKGLIDASDAASRINTARDLAHSRIESTLGNAVTDGTLDESGLREQFKGLSDDPLAPNYMSQGTRAALIGRAKERTTFDLAKSQAAQAMGGASVVLNESQHGRAVAELVGPKGAGLIDAAGIITEPDALAVSLARADMNPAAVRQTLMGNLASNEPERVIAAARTIGLLARSKSQAWTDLYDSGSNAVDQATLLKTQMEFESGGGQISPGAVQRIADFREKLTENPELAVVPDASKLKSEYKLDLGKISKGVMEDVRGQHPWAIDTLLGIDWINPDPSLTDYSGQADRQAQRWFREYFTVARLSEPTERAVTHAKEYAANKFKAEFDFVRWGGSVQVVPTRAQDGTPIPPAWRWGTDHEDEARKDLESLAPSLGVKPDAIKSMRPYAGGDGSLGWAYSLDDGGVLTDTSGNVVLWQPGTDTIARNEKAIAERKRLLAEPTEDYLKRKYPGQVFILP